MIESEKVKKVLYGGDYNPEQWPEEIWEEDMRLFALAGINVVTLNVFSWASLQPSEQTYDFSKLDKIMKLVSEHSLQVCLATSTAVHPAWMARKHPDVLRTEFNGLRRTFGGRHNSCPNSSTYHKYSALLAQKLAERYGHMPNLVAWHVSNEYGGECHCEQCADAFRVWLKERYESIDMLNTAWNTSFWGHTLYTWEDVVLPNMSSEHFATERTMFQGISLDYRRFMNDSILACYRKEYEALKKITPHIPITTNMMGTYKPLDYHTWAPYLDFISWDNYPSYESTYHHASFSHDLMRGLKGGKPFCLMEQTPSVTNWLPKNSLKRPGVMRLWSYQSMAHGSDTVMFFQMRRSIGACEKYHGAVIDHAGHENTRVFREVSALGKELNNLESITLGGRTPSRVALLFDWENWWAIEYSAGPSCDLKYLDEILLYYKALSRLGVCVDVISDRDDLSPYSLVIAPLLYMIHPQVDDHIRQFVKQGGTFLTGFFSGYVDQNDRVFTGGYPGPLSDVTGIWVEELDALIQDDTNSFVYEGVTYPTKLICDLLHCSTATPLASYTNDFYAGMPALTHHTYGKGSSYYVATRSNDDFYLHFLGNITKKLNIKPLMKITDGVEVTLRHSDQGDLLYLLNHNATPCTFPFEAIFSQAKDLLSGSLYKQGELMTMMPYDVMILKNIS